MKQVYAQTLQNCQMRVDLAFKAFFRRVKAGEKDSGFPRFKGKGRYDSITYPQGQKGGFKFEGDRLHLSKIGDVRVVLHRPVEGTIKTLTIRLSSTGKWYACFVVEYDPMPVPQTVVGIDVGLESFATLSNGEKIENPRFFRIDEKALAKAQRKLSKVEKGTPERKKARKIVAHIHERIATRRLNFAHQTSRKLVERFGVIAVEELAFTALPASTDLHADFDFKKMRGYQDFYRIRVGKYLIGCRLTATGALILYRVKSREEIYSVFP
ncbi:MAG: transposase [Methanofollis sp.]|uniref:transposase n=1 Tax=Methanofollis sp. TaxID=2052835 RepID=UPI002603AE61|nr:transposase [Methanofollis sp.]MDD4256074.1 transposase [Methanofollis sp.]